jgi:hypothetical protein
MVRYSTSFTLLMWIYLRASLYSLKDSITFHTNSLGWQISPHQIHIPTLGVLIYDVSHHCIIIKPLVFERNRLFHLRFIYLLRHPYQNFQPLTLALAHCSSVYRSNNIYPVSRDTLAHSVAAPNLCLPSCCSSHYFKKMVKARSVSGYLLIYLS